LASTLPRTPEGTIDPGGFPRWLTRNQPAIDAFPELERRFGTAAAAEQAVQDAVDKRVADKKAQHRSATTLFIGRDPITAVGRALSGGNAEANFRELTTAVRGNDAAEMGLRRATVEYLRQKMGDKGFVRNEAFVKFLQQSRPALRQLFSDGHLDAIEQLAKRFGGNAHGESAGDILTFLAAEHITGHSGGGLIGAAAVAAKKLGNSMRGVGLHRFDQIMDEAMLNPALARTLVTPKNQPALWDRFVTQLRAVGAEAPANAESRQRDSLDAATRGVAAMAPGTAITTRQLAQLSGRGDISDVRNRLVARGLIAQRNGRYVRADTANAGVALAPSEIAQPKPDLTVNRALLDSVHKAIQQRAPTLRRQSLLDMGNEIEGRPSPYYGTYRPGGLLEHTAAISQGSPMTHDVVNLLRRSGGIPREEWSVLAKKADEWAKRLGIDGPSPSIRREEAVAQTYNRWRSGDMQLPPGLRRIMGNIPSVAEGAAA
jgi:hypothetical protein